MTTRATSVWLAIRDFGHQLLLWGDQGGNVIICGVGAVLRAAITGARQNVGYADETLSAHAWRSYDRRTWWGRIWKPVIDFLWWWQAPDAVVNAKAGRAVTGHCERAFWKERLRRDMPPEYRDDPPEPAQ
jgi:hypothetical protein